MDGVVIERTRPRLVSRCGLRKDRNCVPRAALNERHPHRTCVPKKRYKIWILTLPPGSCEARGSAARGPGERGGVPRGVCPRARVYAMRDGILSKEKGTPTPAHAGSAHAPRPHAHGAPSPHDRASPGWRVPTLRRKREAHSTLRSSSRTLSHRHDKPPRRRLRRRRPLEDYSTCAPSSCYLGDV